MAKTSRGSHLAREAGKSFEALFEVHCRQKQMGFTKIPDGCYRIKTPYGIKLVACRTPFDYFICKNGRAAALDCKTINADSFSFSMLDKHQVEALYELGSHVASGYIIWFRISDKVCFFDSKILMGLVSRTALIPEDGLLLGSIDRFDPEKIIETYKPTGQQGSLI
jgi:penicillin-binding protein-related factor A (putative recombinase)